MGSRQRRKSSRSPVLSLALCGVCAGCSVPEPGDALPSLDASTSVLPREASGQELPVADAAPRVLRIPARVHVGRSGLETATLAAVLAEINEIWLGQAGICFEFETVAHEERAEAALDLFFTATPIPGAEDVNGVYRGFADIWSLDEPDLQAAPNPTRLAPSRTAAHELGHALGLSHQNCGQACPCEAPASLDCDDLLLRSGYRGFGLTEPEITIARATAAKLALADTAPVACAPHDVAGP